MEKILFFIKNLSCGYNGKGEVLYIDDLVIPSNKMLFILGLSGIGKSTFIETLGVMNDTIINKDSSEISFFDSGGLKTDIISLWRDKDIFQSAFRKKYLSFIFQNTNLMPNMSAGENVCISLLFEGMTLTNAKQMVLKVFSDLSLSEDIYDKDISTLSGGERQRIAFARGLLSEFEVLFGDEPTGNLDKKTATDAMASLKKSLDNINKSSLIVTHDPQMALHFGDGIILIYPMEKANGKKTGFISGKNMYLKSDKIWIDQMHNPVNDIEKLVYEALEF